MKIYVELWRKRFMQDLGLWQIDIMSKLLMGNDSKASSQTIWGGLHAFTKKASRVKATSGVKHKLAKSVPVIWIQVYSWLDIAQ